MTPETIGRYRISGVLGRGGMGVVYAAWDPDLQRKVAIKVIREDGVSAGSARLLREARALARLSHPNVITVYEVASDAGRDFIAMELIEGQTLAAWLRERHSSREVLRAFTEAGRGLAAAHAAGMIHRDFKPQNVLLRGDGRVLVTDFGLARAELTDRPSRRQLPDAHVSLPPGAIASPEAFAATAALDPGETRPETRGDTAAPLGQADTTAEELTRTGALLGTPAYMAPEQFAGDADARSDQFAFCVALWEGLAGAPPFQGASTDEIVDAIRRGPSGELASRRLRAILVRGLSAEPDARWPSMDALLAALERRQRARWAVASGAVLAVATSAVAGYFLLRPAAPAPLRELMGTVRHVTFDDGCEEFPAFAPDGKTIVYDGLAGEGYAIFALDLDGGSPRRLTDPSHWAYKPALSPDGKTVAYIMREDTGASTFVMPIAGGVAKRVGYGGVQPIWSRDGRAVWVGDGLKIDLIDVTSGATLRELAAAEHQRIGEGVLLPDDELAALMFPRSADESGLGVAVFDREGNQRMLVRASMLESIALAPDSRAVLVTHMTETGTRQLWWVPIDGSPHVAVTGDVEPTVGIAVSARGDRIVWSDCAPRTTLGRLSGAPLDRVAIPSGGWTDQEPVSIGGSDRIVVQSDRDGSLRLWVIDLSRKQPPRELPGTENDIGQAAVSFDGATVYAIDHDGALFAQPLDGTRPPARIAHGVRGGPAPRRDGSIIVTLSEGNGALAVVSAGGGTPERIVADATTPAASPASEDIYFVAADVAHRGVVMRRDAAGHVAPLSPALPAGEYHVLEVTRDGKRLAAISSATVIVVDIATGAIAARYDAGAGMITGGTWVGDTVLVSYVDFQGDLWLLQR